MRILNETICWTEWYQCFNEWTLIYIIILNITLFTTILLICYLVKKEVDSK
jgi:hypothetical protein